MNVLWSSLTFIFTFFLMVKHPLSLVLLLILLTVTSMLSFFMYLNLSWLSMVLFLVFLGGLLVIFTYLSALVPNEMYLFNPLWLVLIMSPVISTYYNINPSLNETQNPFITHMLFMNSSSSILLFLLYLLIALLSAMVMAQQLKTPLNQTIH